RDDDGSIVSPHSSSVFFFFFQAEDGIRDFHVTGVQTCALPICRGRQLRRPGHLRRAAGHFLGGGRVLLGGPGDGRQSPGHPLPEIGRASCRERVEIAVVAGSCEKQKGAQRERQRRDWTNTWQKR